MGGAPHVTTSPASARSGNDEALVHDEEWRFQIGLMPRSGVAASLCHCGSNGGGIEAGGGRRGRLLALDEVDNGGGVAW
jgi:hypothetical protein